MDITVLTDDEKDFLATPLESFTTLEELKKAGMLFSKVGIPENHINEILYNKYSRLINKVRQLERVTIILGLTKQYVSETNFRSEFKRSFFPSVIEQMEAGKEMSPKQINIVFRNLTQRDSESMLIDKLLNNKYGIRNLNDIEDIITERMFNDNFDYKNI